MAKLPVPLFQVVRSLEVVSVFFVESHVNQLLPCVPYGHRTQYTANKNRGNDFGHSGNSGRYCGGRYAMLEKVLSPLPQWNMVFKWC